MAALGEIRYIVNFACFYFLKVATRKPEVTHGACITFLSDCAMITETPSNQLFRALFLNVNRQRFQKFEGSL